MNHQDVAIVVVTYNRSELLYECLDSLIAQNCERVGAIFVIDNASTDQTKAVIQEKNSSLIKAISLSENTGGAGGFYTGVKVAYEAGFDWIWMMDDDVLINSDCLTQLLYHEDKKVLIPVREDKNGNLAELSALQYDLKNPFVVRPKRIQVCDVYQNRNQIPTLLKVANFSFEGLLIHRDVVARIGFPFPDYFISSDDVDYAERVKRAGFQIYAVSSAVMIRQLPFNQEEALEGWKGYYMYRNIFVIHFLYGKNSFVRLKPYFLVWVAMLLKPILKIKAPLSQSLKDAQGLARDLKFKLK